MGKKRESKWQYLFLHGTCLLLILFLGVGCAATLNFKEKRQGQDHLDLGDRLVSKGDYEGALKENEEVVRLYPSVSPGDRALFRIGLIWAHPDNPRRNYKRALESFQRVRHDFPRSALKEEAVVSSGVIEELIRRQVRIRDLEETVRGLQERLKELKEIDIRIEKKKREEFSIE